MIFWLMSSLTGSEAPLIDEEILQAEHEIAKSAEIMLLYTIAQETLTASVLTAGAASAVFYACLRETLCSLAEATRLAADFPARMDHWPLRMLDDGLSANAITDVAKFYSEFRSARAALRAFEQEAAVLGAPRAFTLHGGKLAATWQTSTRAARSALLSLITETTVELPSCIRMSADAVDAILARIAKGEPVCCQADGTVVLPNLDERRRSPRRFLLQPVLVSCADQDVSAFARDISSGGLGLTRMPTLKLGTQVLIELSCGRTLSGSVAWSNGTETGIRFDRHLDLTDPLIFG